MDLYYNILRSNNKITYFQIFSGKYYMQYVTINKSYFEFGLPNQKFKKPGEEIYTGSSITENIKYTRRNIIKTILNGEFSFDSGRKIIKNEL